MQPYPEEDIDQRVGSTVEGTETGVVVVRVPFHHCWRVEIHEGVELERSCCAVLPE